MYMPQSIHLNRKKIFLKYLVTKHILTTKHTISGQKLATKYTISGQKQTKNWLDVETVECLVHV